MAKFSYTIRFHQNGSVLLDFLSKNFTYYSNLQWEKEIENLNILLNEKVTKGNDILKTGDRVDFFSPEFKEPDVDKDYKIIYEDEWILAISKSGNLPVHPAGRYKHNTLLEVLKLDFQTQFYIIHRLDRETSGLILVGKREDVPAKFHRMFEKHLIQKEYIVYVYGVFPSQYEACGWIGKDEKSQIRKKQAYFSDPREKTYPTQTNFHLLSENGKISKVLAIPYTGRMHQIRATLFSLGYPLLGDKMYGKDEKVFLEFIETGISETDLINRQALHSYRLTFTHPFTGQIVKIEAEEPEDMLRLLL